MEKPDPNFIQKNWGRISKFSGILLQPNWHDNLEILLKKQKSFNHVENSKLKEKKMNCQMGNFCVVWEIPHEPQAIIQTKVF